MSAAPAAPEPTSAPDPSRSGTDAPTRIGRVLNVVRRLIDYGTRLISAVQQRATAPDFALFTRHFGTADVAAILARITAGLRRATALEAMLCQRAARGKDLSPAPLHLPAAPAPRSPRPSAPRDVQSATQDGISAADPGLARLPTEAEIAAELRRRPVGAVITDICRDLGIMPGQLDRAFWDELAMAIITFGGSLSCFLPKLNVGLFAAGSGPYAETGCSVAPTRSPLPATGPP